MAETDRSSTDSLAISHLQDVKDLRAKIDCAALPAVANVLEDCVTHTLDTRVDVRDLKKYVEEQLPDAIIAKANGNADQISLGFGGKSISGKASTILRLVIALGVAAIVLMMVVTELEKRNLIDVGGKQMVEDIVVKAVAQAVAPNTEHPTSDSQ